MPAASLWLSAGVPKLAAIGVAAGICWRESLAGWQQWRQSRIGWRDWKLSAQCENIWRGNGVSSMSILSYLLSMAEEIMANQCNESYVNQKIYSEIG